MSRTLNGDQGPLHRPHPGPMSGTYLEFDLIREADELRREPAWAAGRNARTLAKYDDLRVVLTVLEAGARIPEHQTEGRISIQGVQGLVQVRAEGRTFSLAPGMLLTLDRGVQHEVEAVEDGAFLLTLAWPRSEGPSAR